MAENTQNKNCNLTSACCSNPTKAGLISRTSRQKMVHPLRLQCLFPFCELPRVMLSTLYIYIYFSIKCEMHKIQTWFVGYIPALAGESLLKLLLSVHQFRQD